MVKIFDDLNGPPLSIDGFFERVTTIDAPPLSAPWFTACAQGLAQLARNRNLISDHLEQVQDLEGWSRSFSAPQSTILARRDTGYLRANVWLPRKDTAFGGYERGLYAYALAHNHDFRFFTVNYFGPGYETELYEIEPRYFEAAPGEHVELLNHRRERLSEGRVFYFERWSDVHAQYEPPSLSISINYIVLGLEPGVEQLLIDVPTSTSLGPPPASESNRMINAIEAAALFGDDTTAGLLATLAEGHRRRTVRAAAQRALREIGQP